MTEQQRLELIGAAEHALWRLTDDDLVTVALVLGVTSVEEIRKFEGDA